MNQHGQNVAVAACVLGVSLCGCDPFSGTSTVEGNEFTRQTDHLWKVGSGGMSGTPEIVFAADLDGDGRDDLVAYHKYQQLSFLDVGINIPPAGYVSGPSNLVTFIWAAQPLILPGEHHLELADLDGDGAEEIAVIDREQGTLTWYGIYTAFHDLDKGGGAFWAPLKVRTESLSCLGSFDMGLALADVNGDGRADILCGLRHKKSWELLVHLMQADQSFGPPISTQMGTVGQEMTGNWKLLVGPFRLADLDGDGHQDLIVTGPSDFGPGLKAFFGDGSGRFPRAALLCAQDGITYTYPTVTGDLNGDGLADVVWKEGSSASLSVFFGSRKQGALQKGRADANLMERWAYWWPPAPARGVAGPWSSGDLDGDGLDDLAWIGTDRDYGYEGPVFLRVLRGTSGGPKLASNTQVGLGSSSHVCRVSWCDPVLVGVTGSFLGNGHDQVLVTGYGLLGSYQGYRIYDWVERPDQQEAPRCGDAQVQGTEQCDGLALYDHDKACKENQMPGGGCVVHEPDCRDRGFAGGLLSCNDRCRYDTSGCHRHLTLGHPLKAPAPAAACSGGQCLVAWTDGANIDGRRVSPAKGTADSALLRITSGADPSSPHVAVAGDGVGFWVLWSDRDQAIRAARVGQDGKLVGPESILATGGKLPEAACGQGHCLVAWHGASGIEALRMDKNGRPLPSGSVTVVAAGSGQVTGPVALASDQTGYLVAWECTQGGTSDILAARVDGSGKVQDSSGIAVAVGPGSQKTPTVAYNGKSYLVLFVDDATRLGTYGVRVSPGGKLLDSIRLPLAAGLVPGVASCKDRFFVASRQWSSLIGTRISSSGRVLDFLPMKEDSTTLGWPDSSCDPAPKAVRPALAFDGSRLIVVYSTKDCLAKKTSEYTVVGSVVDPLAL